MIDHDVLEYIRDEMLTNPEIDCQFIYMCTYLGDRDYVMYQLLNEWMKEADDRDKVEKRITSHLNHLLAVDGLYA